MTDHVAAIQTRGLVRRYGSTEAVDGLDLRVAPGRCYGFFGRNGAGKTTTIKCLLNLLRPSGGEVRLFGLDPARDEVAVKSRVGYVPDQVAFYPWMTVRDTLDYVSAFHPRWNRRTEQALVAQFGLEASLPTSALSKGQRTQLAIVLAVSAEPDLLVLDEPTSGLDPIVRRDVIQTVIGTYQEGDPERRTVFLSTHLIAEFEGLIDEFTVIDRGRAVMTLGADDARQRHQTIRVRFTDDPGPLDLPGARVVRRHGRSVELAVNGDLHRVHDQLRACSPEAIEVVAMTLEQIVVSALQPQAGVAG